MSRFGWAYVNSLVTGAVANGPTNSVQFNSGSQVLSGSSNFTFNPATNTLIVTGTISASVYQGISATPTPAGTDKQIQYNSGSTLGASSNLTFDYNTSTLYLTGTLRADNLIVSSSQILKSGSTIFGDDLSDTHQFTGSILGGIVSGTIARFVTITGSTALITNITGNLFGTASFATNAATASLLSGFDKNDYVLTSSFNNFTSSYNTGSFSGSFTGSLLGTSSYASNADLLDNRDSTTFAGTGSNTFNGNQIITGTLDVSSILSGTTAQFTTITGSTIISNLLRVSGTSENVIDVSSSSPAFKINQQGSGFAFIVEDQVGPDASPFVIAANGDVGIGTSIPTEKLHVIGAIKSTTTISGTTAQFTTITSQGATITGSLLMSGTSYISEVDYIDFDVAASTPPHKNGRVYWNNTDGCLDVYSAEADITLQVGQENWTRIRNNTGTTITNGTVVRIIGAQGDAPTVERAQSIAKSGSINVDTQILGVATHDIEDSSFGYVTTQGLVRGLNTNAFADGDTLFVGTGSAGALQNTAPVAPYEIIPVGVCVKASPGTSGIIYVAVQQPLDFSDLSSVFVSGNYAYGDIWTYVSSSNTGYWIHTNTLSGSYTITGSLIVTNNISGATGQFTSLTASSISANSVPAFGPNQSIQYNSSNTLAGSSNLTFDGTQVRLTGSMQVVSSSTAVVELVSTGVRTTGKPIQVRNVSTAIVAVMDENGIVSGSTGRFGNVTGSVITSSNEILVANNATIGGNIIGSGAIKGGYLTYTGSFVVPSTSYFVGISTTGSVVTASLNSATTYPAGQTMYFKDVGGNAGTNNIRIQPSGSQTIDGATSLVISSTSGSATLVSNGVDGFYIVGLT